MPEPLLHTKKPTDQGLRTHFLPAFLLYSEWLKIPIGAGLCAYAQLQLGGRVDLQLTMLAGLAPFVFYSLIYRAVLKQQEHSQNRARVPASFKHQYYSQSRFIQAVIIAAICGMLWSVATGIGWLSLALLLIIAGLGCWYSGIAGIFAYGHSFHLRNHYSTKTPALVICWVALTLGLPLLESGVLSGQETQIQQHGWYLLFFYTSWIGINTIFFDLKDMGTDRKTGIKTYPVVFGKYLTLLLLGLLNTSCLLTFLHAQHGTTLGVSIITPNIAYFGVLFQALLQRGRFTQRTCLLIDLALLLPLITLVLGVG